MTQHKNLPTNKNTLVNPDVNKKKQPKEREKK